MTEIQNSKQIYSGCLDHSNIRISTLFRISDVTLSRRRAPCRRVDIRILLTSMAVLISSAAGQTVYCPRCPEKKQKEIARSIMESFHVYNCCDGTIAQCLVQKPVCALAERLKNYVCRLVKNGKGKKANHGSKANNQYGTQHS